MKSWTTWTWIFDSDRQISTIRIMWPSLSNPMYGSRSHASISPETLSASHWKTHGMNRLYACIPSRWCVVVIFHPLYLFVAMCVCCSFLLENHTNSTTVYSHVAFVFVGGALIYRREIRQQHFHYSYTQQSHRKQKPSYITLIVVVFREKASFTKWNIYTHKHLHDII